MHVRLPIAVVSVTSLSPPAACRSGGVVADACAQSAPLASTVYCPSDGRIVARLSCDAKRNPRFRGSALGFHHAEMGKHVAAVLYGIGARLDQEPDVPFTLRKVDHLDLLSAGTRTPSAAGRFRARTLAASDLGNLFGIALDVPSELE